MQSIEYYHIINDRFVNVFHVKTIINGVGGCGISCQFMLTSLLV